MSDSETLPVERLFKMEAITTKPIAIKGGPQGTRLILGVTGGSFEGPKLKGIIESSPGGEWATVREDGTLKADVRILLRTYDDAPILMTYQGVITNNDGRMEIRTAPLFETGDSRYTWLNAVQAVGIGRPTEDGVGYEVYAVL